MIYFTQLYQFQSVSKVSFFCHRSRSFSFLQFMCVPMGQSVRGGLHILPSSLFVVNLLRKWRKPSFVHTQSLLMRPQVIHGKSSRCNITFSFSMVHSSTAPSSFFLVWLNPLQCLAKVFCHVLSCCLVSVLSLHPVSLCWSC